MPLTKSTIETMKPPPVPAQAFDKSNQMNLRVVASLSVPTITPQVSWRKFLMLWKCVFNTAGLDGINSCPEPLNLQRRYYAG